MIYEVLLKDNIPVSFEEVGFEWGIKECPPVFEIIEYECDEVKASEIMASYRWLETKFIHKETGLDFENKITPAVAPIEDTKASLIEASQNIDPNWQDVDSDACSYLHTTHTGGFEESRLYWYKKFIYLKDLDGMEAFLGAIRFNNYGGIWEVGKTLPKETWDAILSSYLFTKEDKEWIRNLWQLQ